MNNDISTQKIKALLDIATTQLTAETLDKLRMARTHAIDRQRIQHRVPVLAWLGGHYFGRNESFHLSKPMGWLIGAVFAACLMSGATLWSHYTTEREICDLDIAILTDELPIHVYLD